MKLGENNAFARRDAYSSVLRKTPSVILHSFSEALGNLNVHEYWLSVLAIWLGKLKVIVVDLLV